MESLPIGKGCDGTAFWPLYQKQFIHQTVKAR